MNLQRTINPFLTVFDEGLYPFSVCGALQKRKKGFIIRCKFINLYFFQCTRAHYVICDRNSDLSRTIYACIFCMIRDKEKRQIESLNIIVGEEFNKHRLFGVCMSIEVNSSKNYHVVILFLYDSEQ
jgi:hypothetical protein